MTDPRVFLIHGFEGTPEGGWRTWLKSKLALQNIYARTLSMPSPFSPDKDEWVATIARTVGDFSENTILVGHSLGGTAILNYLETLPPGRMIAGAVLVASPIDRLEAEDENSIYRKIDGFFKNFDFEKIKASAADFTIIQATDDTAVPFAHAEILARALSAELVRLPRGGHLSDNYLKLPEALAAVEDILNQ